MTKTTQKEKIQFTCCGFEAFGFRQCLRLDGVIWNTAKCPKCGTIFKLSKWEKK
jgi:hypothetical protein